MIKSQAQHLWNLWSNIFLRFFGDTPLIRRIHFWWNHPLGDVCAAAAAAFKRRLFPRVHLPAPAQLSDRHFRLRVLLLLIVSAALTGLLNGFGDLPLLFVSIPFVSLQLSVSSEVRILYFGLSIFSASILQALVFRFFLGSKEYPLRSINGMLFWLMGIFFLNVADNGVMALSMQADRISSPLIRYLLMYAALLLALISFSDLTDNFLSILFSLLAAQIMRSLGTTTYYLCLPAILLTEMLRLSQFFSLQFFFNLCTVLITLGIGALLERFGLLQKLKQLCTTLTIAKVFFLLPYALLPLGLLIKLLF